MRSWFLTFTWTMPAERDSCSRKCRRPRCTSTNGASSTSSTPRGSSRARGRRSAPRRRTSSARCARSRRTDSSQCRISSASNSGSTPWSSSIPRVTRPTSSRSSMSTRAACTPATPRASTFPVTKSSCRSRRRRPSTWRKTSRRSGGSSKLARIALDTMELAIMEAKGRPDPKALTEVARRISAAQPAMAIVHNVVHLVARLVSEGQDPKAVIEATRAELDGARSRIARTFLTIAPPRGIVATLSSSETVLEALKLANARGLIVRVDALESAPGFEGRTFAASLTDAGIPVTVVPDPEGPARLATASYALVGADSVLRDGSVVNKIGTQALALAAKDHEKRFYVACETLKFDARYDSTSSPHRPDTDRLFDLTPAELVTMVVTDRKSVV